MIGIKIGLQKFVNKKTDTKLQYKPETNLRKETI